jgi:chorismate synthase
MPIRFRTVVKPTPSIAKQQDTVDLCIDAGEDSPLPADMIQQSFTVPE